MRDLQYYNSHQDQRSHFLSFARCTEMSCERCLEFHRQNPIPKNFNSALRLPTKADNGSIIFRLSQILKMLIRFTGALWYTAEPDEKFPGRNKTYIQHCKELSPAKKYFPDSDLSKQPLARCQVCQPDLVRDCCFDIKLIFQDPSCLVSFKSKAAQVRHNNLLHWRAVRSEMRAEKKRVRKAFSCTICNTKFSSKHYLSQHKKEENHFLAGETRGRKKKC